MLKWQELTTYLIVVSTVGAMLLFTPLWAPNLVHARFDGSWRSVQRIKRGNFTLSELACGFVYVGVANVLFNTIRADYDRFPMWGYVMPILCNALALLTWWLSLQFTDKQGISGNKSRFVSILFFFPLAACLMAHVIAAAFLAFGEVFLNYEIRGYVLLQLLGALCVSSASMLVLRVAFKRMTDRDPPPPPPIDVGAPSEDLD